MKATITVPHVEVERIAKRLAEALGGFASPKKTAPYIARILREELQVNVPMAIGPDPNTLRSEGGAFERGII